MRLRWYWCRFYGHSWYFPPFFGWYSIGTDTRPYCLRCKLRKADVRWGYLWPEHPGSRPGA